MNRMNRMNLAEQYRAKPKCDEEIADAYARGMAPDEIARELGVLPLTVERGLQRQGLLRLVPRESAGPVELGVGDPVRCPDETWCVWAGEVPRMWGSSEAAVLSDVSERVGSVDLARELMEGGARRWELIADAHPALHRALVRKLRVMPQPAPAPALPPTDDEDEEEDAPMSALEDVMEHVSEEMKAMEVAAEASTPAPEEIAPEASTLIEDATCEDCALAEGLCVICAERDAALDRGGEESTPADAHPAYQWMTANELAPLMQVEKSTLRLWAKSGKLEVRDAPAGRARGPKAKEYRIPPGQPVPVPLVTGGRARHAPAADAPAVSPSRIQEEIRQHMLLTEARSRCAELDAQIEDLTAQLAEHDGVIADLRAALDERASFERLTAGSERIEVAAPPSLRSVLDEVARWTGCAVIGLDIRLETGARLGVTP